MWSNLIKDTRPIPSDFISLSLPLFFERCIYFWLCWVSIAGRAPSLAMVSGRCSLAWGRDFLLQGLLLWWYIGSGCMDLTSCSAWDQLPHGMWDLPGPGIELVSLELQGEFLTTGLPGKPSLADLFKGRLSRDSPMSRYLGI